MAGDADGSSLGDIVGDILDEKPVTKVKHYKAKGMLLGVDRDKDKPVDIKPQVLARHAAMLGSTGSGKTVMAKALIEEACIAGIPSLILDPQGDLARLVMGIDEKELEEQGGDVSRRKKYLDGAEVRIWTPLRSKGLPLCIDPFNAPPPDLDPEEAITAWDMVASGFASLTSYDLEKAQGKQVKSFLYEILVHGTRLGIDVGDFQSLARVVRDPHDAFLRHLCPDAFDEEDAEEITPWAIIAAENGLPTFDEMLPKTTRHDLSRRLAAFSTGVNQLLFSNGVPIDIDSFKESSIPGKTPINVIYLNTIQDEGQKHYFVQELARELYSWMLDQIREDGKLQLLFFMDEVAPYLPPVKNPPAKELVKLIFKQARKYGVACVLATQNVSDVDYKILAQANTLFLGKFTQKQDVDKVKAMASGLTSDYLDELPNMKAGQFHLVSADVSPEPIRLQCRWLYSDHGDPLTEEQVEEYTSAEVRAWAKTRSAGRRKASGAGAASAAALGGRSLGEEGDEESIVQAARIKSVSGMAAAGKGVVDDSAFEVRLMGGLGVLKDGRDPLYVMQAAANATTVLALGWSLVALMLNWRDASIDWWWLVGGALMTSGVGLVVALEMLLSHDAELLRKLTKFAHATQAIMVGWLWGLLIWSYNGLELHGAQPLVEVVVVWTTLFLLTDWIYRLRLGRLDWGGGSPLDRLLGLTAVLTEAQLTDMKANSKQVMAAQRWIVDMFTLFWLCVILLKEGDVWSHPTLWLASYYALSFCSESWLRMRGRLPDPEV